MRNILCNLEVIQQFDEANRKIILKEETTNQQIELGGIPKDATIIKLDIDKSQYKQKSKYLRSGHEFIHQGCDYAILLPVEKKIILIELKSKRPKGFVDQFKASEIFLSYVNSLCCYVNCEIVDYQFKWILFSEKYSIQTTSKSLLYITRENRCKQEEKIYIAGFPNRIMLQRLL